MTWFEFYNKNKHIGNINEVVTQYNMYVYQNKEQYEVELIRKSGNSDMFILLENGYILLQEGFNQYGLLQEIR